MFKINKRNIYQHKTESSKYKENIFLKRWSD